MAHPSKLDEPQTRQRHAVGQPRETSRWGYLMITAAVSALVPGQAMATPPGWRLVWNDDFDTLNEQKWDRVNSDQPTNNSKHAYLPEQVSVTDGKLVITSENKPSGKLPYRSGEVISKREQRLYGRWEVRAKLPTTPGMWPAIWLFAPARSFIGRAAARSTSWRTRGIGRRRRGANYYGMNPPFQHSYVFNEQQTSQGGKLVSSGGYHTYAVDWLGDQLRFYVDDVNYYTVYDEDVNGYLSQHTQPMRVMLNTAVGGDFLPGPDDTTVWPQRFLIDSVRIYSTTAERFATSCGTGASTRTTVRWPIGLCRKSNGQRSEYLGEADGELARGQRR